MSEAPNRTFVLWGNFQTSSELKGSQVVGVNRNVGVNRSNIGVLGVNRSNRSK